MNIFVIAPLHGDLPDVSREIAAIARHHNAEILRGQVRDLDIGTKLDQLESDGFIIDAIWWITHGSADGVLLSDGLLDTQGAGQYVKKSGAHLCVFNTCDSEEVALSIVAGSEADMIYTVGDVKNRVAVRFGILLAPALAENEDYRTAFDNITQPGGPYRYLEAKAYYRRRGHVDALEQVKVILYVLIGMVLLAAFGIYREVLVVQDRQTQIIANQQRILDTLDKFNDNFFSLETRIIRIQLAMPGGEYVKDGP